MSKITSSGVRENVHKLLEYSTETKEKLLETVELQVGLKTMILKETSVSLVL